MSDWEAFKKIRNLFSKLFDSKKSKYYVELEKRYGSASQKLWKLLYPYLNPNKKSIIKPIIHDNVCYNTPADLAYLFLNYFSNILKNFSLFSLEICLNYINSFMFLSFHEKNISELDIGEISVDSVLEALKKLDVFTSPGYSGIPAILFKTCADELKEPITALFNSCISSGTIPDEWKIAIVTPVHKGRGKGSKSNIDSYRPISVIMPLAKLFESFIVNSITAHFEKFELFHPNQFGFRKHMSCELALNSIIENWRFSLNKNEDVVSIFLDLRKAFDSIDHDLLLAKLPYYGFSKQTINLLKNYLTDRKFCVKIGDFLSRLADSDPGLPQGSNLGPLLFIIFMNDINFLNIVAKIFLFADDTTISFSSKCVDELKSTLLNDLRIITDWLSYNRLQVNWSKTKAMIIAHSHHSQHKFASFSLSVGNNNIEIVKTAKVLGVTIDNNLRFEEHILGIRKKINSKALIISRSMNLFSPKFKITLFKLFIMPHFEYCSTIYAGPNALFSQYLNTRMKSLCSCFSRYVRLFLKVKLRGLENDYKKQTRVLSPFNILPLVLRLYRHYCHFVFNMYSQRSAPYLVSLYLPADGHYSLRNKLSNPQNSNNFGLESFINLSTHLLNQFIESLVGLSKEKFKKKLNQCLHELYGESCLLINY